MSDHGRNEPPKLWGGRFTESTDAFVEAFTASITFDQRLYRHDIRGSIAHATMLCTVGVLTEVERDQITEGLEAIEAEIDAGHFTWAIELEDGLVSPCLMERGQRVDLKQEKERKVLEHRSLKMI